ncbi:MAG TPA: tRNA lysidine(34) synthetase TilS [Candidatus Deferrimicrobium sp.]
MPPEEKKPNHRVVVAAVSGGPDSVYLLLGKLAREKGTRIVVGHVNYSTRGKDSLKDQASVENIGKKYGYKTYILIVSNGNTPGSRAGFRGRFPAGFEKKAREIRYRFLKELSEKAGAEAIALAHTADDQVETILMRILEGAGIGGLKGIPRESGDGIVHPILDVWKEDILNYLKKRKIQYRIDRSNSDTRFERNWVRNVLLPLLVNRYGKTVKKRIFTLGERFRELDDYLEDEAGGWIRRNVIISPGRRPNVDVDQWTQIEDKSNYKGPGQVNKGAIVFRRKTFSELPSVLRVKILQRICFDRLGVAPNERLLKAMDGNVLNGGPSARVNAGKGWKLANRYEEALFVPGENGRERKSAGSTPPSPILISTPGEYNLPLGQQGPIVTFAWEAKKKGTPAQARRLAAKGDAEVFDAAGLTLPLMVRPLRVGDRIRPFGGGARGNARDSEKKVKEILIDRKIPRDDRWGRPVVCDAEGVILWIPGVLRSSWAPVTPETRKTALLRIRSAK